MMSSIDKKSKMKNIKGLKKDLEQKTKPTSKDKKKEEESQEDDNE